MRQKGMQVRCSAGFVPPLPDPIDLHLEKGLEILKYNRRRSRPLQRGKYSQTRRELRARIPRLMEPVCHSSRP